jgi:hypothetical protein
MVVVDAERPARRALGFPPFGGLAELSGDVDAVAHACRELRARAPAVTVLGPVDGGRRALARAPGFGELCDGLARAEVDAAHAVGRLRVDVDPRRA